MQEEVEQRVVTLVINCTKLTEQELRKALGKFLDQIKTNYKYTSDYDKRNELDIERFLSHRLKLKPDQACAVYDFSQSD